MTRRLLALTLLASALSACQLGGDTETFVPSDRCTPVQGACQSNADCCSYGCMSGVCVPNPVPGGVCRTSDDCGVLMDATGYHYMGCKSGACAIDVVCRDDADVCDADNDCCSGNCVGATWGVSGTCTPNSAPVVELGADREIPYNRTTTLQATVSDRDADTLVYGWTLVSAPPGSTAVISDPTAATPTFVPTVTGAYRFRVVVTDGPSSQRNRLSAQDEVTLTAINTAPVVVPGTGSTHASRNVLQTTFAQVSDADLDPLTCTWKVSSPGHPEEILRGPEPCGGAVTTASFTPNLEETWTATLEVTDGVNTTVATEAFVCVNDPPVADPIPLRAGNVGGGAVPIQAIVHDANGDTTFEYAWSFDQVPTGSAVGATALPATAGVSFVPDLAGQYVLRLRVSDRPGSYTESTVQVQVDRRIVPLPEVRFAAYAKAVNRLVIAGPDPADATKGRITILDAATGTEVTSAQLSGLPTCVDTNPDATLIAAGGGSALWWVTVSGTTATPNVTTLVPFSIGDVVAVDARRIYLLSLVGSGVSNVYGFDTQNAAQAPAATSALGNKASLDPTTRNSLFVWNSSWGEIRRYSVNPSGQVSASLGSTTTYAGVSGIADLWVAQSGNVVFLSSGAIHSTLTLARLNESLGIAPTFVDSAADGRVVATVLGATQLYRFAGPASQYAAAGTDALPLWGVDGSPNQTTAKYVFLSSDGNTRYAIVSGVGGFGLVTFP